MKKIVQNKNKGWFHKKNFQLWQQSAYMKWQVLNIFDTIKTKKLCLLSFAYSQFLLFNGLLFMYNDVLLLFYVQTFKKKLFISLYLY